MRLSPSRLRLRALLLLLVAGFMLWRGFDTRASAAAPGQDAGSALLLGRIALLEWVLGGLALVTAGFALSALRGGRPGPERVRPLRLGDGPTPGPGPGRGPGEPGAAPPGSNGA